MEEKLSIRSEITERQHAFLYAKAKEALGDTMDEIEIQQYMDMAYRRYVENTGLPLAQLRAAERHHLPFLEEVYETFEEIVTDLGILYRENEIASNFLLDSFNYVHSEKKRMTSRIQGLNSLVGDLNLIAGENTPGNIYFKESFEKPEAGETSLLASGVVKAQVASQEGVLTLSRRDTANVSLESKINAIQGNGDAGTSHIARRIRMKNKSGVEEDVFIFLNENEAMKNDDPSVLLDARPDTIFEYQMVNVPTSFVTARKKYDFDWNKSKETGDALRLKVIVELDNPGNINWINVNPYAAPNSTSKLKVYSIRTSMDGFEYKGLFEDRNYIINQELNDTPQTYRVDALFDGKNKFDEAKFTAQGVWSFPTREARFVEFVFDQEQSYPEVIGQYVYYMQIEGQQTWVQTPEPEELKDQPAGEYTKSLGGESVVYRKVVEATSEGWRYAVGLRDINIMRYAFEEKSLHLSERYTIDGEISKVMLYANEKIPDSYLNIISESNDWIQYEVSFNDTDWYGISPMHHEPVKDVFNPKIIEVNGNTLDLAASFQIHKQQVTTKTPDGVRLRITLKRPLTSNMEWTTPILEDYALRIIKKEDTV